MTRDIQSSAPCHHVFDFSDEELHCLNEHTSLIYQWTKLDITVDSQCTVHACPLPLVTRKHRIHELLKRAIIDPKDSLLPVIQSMACRQAIMFGDVLSPIECQHLMDQVQHCKNPFVCAHGRPSMVPLAFV